MAEQLRVIEVWLAIAAEGLAAQYMIYYDAIKNFGTVTDGGVLSGTLGELTTLVTHGGAGAASRARVPHARAGALSPTHERVRRALAQERKSSISSRRSTPTASPRR